MFCFVLFCLLMLHMHFPGKISQPRYRATDRVFQECYVEKCVDYAEKRLDYAEIDQQLKQC